MTDERVRRSKLLSYVLRHHPEEFGLELDSGGWVPVRKLLDALERAGRGMTRAELDHVVSENPKRRFAFGANGDTIRAQQGHSVDVDLEYEPARPPDVLFHGTVAAVVDSIRREGLTRRSRHHVHLSADRDTARSVGSRRGRAVVLVVRAAEMHGAGHQFFRTPNGVWLTEAVPPELIDFPD